MFPAPTLWCCWGWRRVGGGPCWARGSGCGPGCYTAPARGVRLGVAPVDGGHPDPAPRGGRALAVWGGPWGAVVSGDVEEGVKEEVSDAFPQGGCLDHGGRPDAGAGAGDAEAQRVLFPESPEVLPYRCGVV